MPTGQQIINGALTTLGILEQGGIPSVSDTTDALAEFNAMWEAMGTDEGWIYTLLPFSGALSAGVGTYTLGLGATFNTPRPTRVYEAYFILTGVRTKLNIVEVQEYSSHKDLSAAATAPDELYPDYNMDANGYMTLKLFPVPSGGGTLYLLNAAVFVVWDLVTNVLLPPAYSEALEHSLAWHLIPRFGASIDQSIVQHVNELATKAEARIRDMNAKNRQLPPQIMGLQPPQQPQIQQPIVEE